MPGPLPRVWACDRAEKRHRTKESATNTQKNTEHIEQGHNAEIDENRARRVRKAYKANNRAYSGHRENTAQPYIPRPEPSEGRETLSVRSMQLCLLIFMSFNQPQKNSHRREALSVRSMQLCLLKFESFNQTQKNSHRREAFSVQSVQLCLLRFGQFNQTQKNSHRREAFSVQSVQLCLLIFASFNQTQKNSAPETNLVPATPPDRVG